MADGKLNLVTDQAKGGTSVGSCGEKSCMGIPDELKDQVASESSIPLSPQWLYTKHNENKDTRHGISADAIHKDSWRLDGTQDKKEWRRSVPDIENNRRWRDEERETSLLGRRDRRKEVDRENEYRKNDRRSDNKIDRENSDPRNLLNSERHDVYNRNSTHEGRRDSKWSTRWGPEDKDKDTRADKKVDVDKEDQLSEKQSYAGNARSLTETDSRDKWRPRHRQEYQSSASSVYRGAPGFGVDKNRVENSNVGFAHGRGRGSFARSLPPIGALHGNESNILHGNNISYRGMYRYPRGRLLDIYRKHMNTPLFDKTSETFEDAPPITQEGWLLPLAFVKPNAEEGVVLEDITKGKITNSEISHKSNSEKKTDVCESELDKSNTILLHNDDNSLVNSIEYKTDLDVLNGLDCSFEEFYDARALSEIISVDDGNCNDKKNEVNNSGMIEGNNKSSSFDFSLSSNLPTNSNILYDIPIPTGTISNDKRGILDDEVRIQEQIVPPEEMSLFYRDPQGEIQGPFLGADIISWFEQGFFGTDLPVCLSDDPEGTQFVPLGELMPHLMLNSNAMPVHNPIEQIEPLDVLSGKLNIDVPASDGMVSVSSFEKQWISSGSDSSFDPRVLSKISKRKGSTDPSYGRLPTNPEISPAISLFESQTTRNLVEQDAEEVVYTARPASTNENPLGKLANDLRELSLNTTGHQYSTHETMGSKSANQISTENDINPLRMLWSELEGIHAKHPLSSNLGADTSFSSTCDPAQRDHDAWPINKISTRSASSNVLDAMHSNHLGLLEQEAIMLEEHMLSQQFVKQQQLQQQKQLFQQQHLMPHQNMHSTVPYIEQVQGSLQHPQSYNQPMLELEHYLNLQLQQEQHLQQLQHQQQLQHLIQQQQEQQQQQQLQQQLQRQQEQLLLDRMLQQQLHDPSFGTTADQYLFKQRVLHEMQKQQLAQVPRHHEPTIEELIQAKFGHPVPQHYEPSIEELIQAKYGNPDQLLEQRLRLHLQQEQFSSSRNIPLLPTEQLRHLGLQQEQLQAQQYPRISSQHPGYEKDKVWSVDESGQFVRTLSSSGRPNHLDSSQPLQRHMSFDQKRQAGIFQGEQNSQSFGRTGSMHGSDVDLVDALARLQGLDVSDMHSTQRGAPNQFTNMHLDAIENHWPERSRKMSSSVVESHVSQLQHEAMKHNRDINANLTGRDPNFWASHMDNEGNSIQGLADMLHHDMVRRSSQSVDMEETAQPSYAKRDVSWPFTHSSSEQSFNLSADKVVLSDSLGVASNDQTGKYQQDQMISNIEKYGSSAILGSNKNYQDVGNNERELVEYLDGDNANSHDVDPLASIEGNIVENKVKLSRADIINSAESGTKQKISYVMNHGDLEANKKVGHVSITSTGGIPFYNVIGTDNRHSRVLANQVPGIPVGQDQNIKPLSSQYSALSSASSSTKGKNLPSSAPSEDVSSSTSMKNASMRQKQASSTSHASQEASSFIDMLKSTKKMAPHHESEFSTESHESGPGNVKGSSSKKKGKKGRQIDPSLLGFKVHSNRILMGEIQRPED